MRHLGVSLNTLFGPRNEPPSIPSPTADHFLRRWGHLYAISQEAVDYFFRDGDPDWPAKQKESGDFILQAWADRKT